MSILQYENGRPEEAKDVEIFYLVLGEMKYDEDYDPEKVWEIIDGVNSLSVLYDWLKANYMWLDLDNTMIYKSENSREKECCVDLSKEGTTAYNTLKWLQGIFIEDDFDIDDVIENNIY